MSYETRGYVSFDVFSVSLIVLFPCILGLFICIHMYKYSYTLVLFGACLVGVVGDVWHCDAALRYEAR